MHVFSVKICSKLDEVHFRNSNYYSSTVCRQSSMSLKEIHAQRHICLFYCRRRDKLPSSIQRVAFLGFLRTPASSDTHTNYQTSPTSPVYEEIKEPTSPTHIYSMPSARSASCNQYELERAISGRPSPSSSIDDNNGLHPTAPPAAMYSKPFKPAKPSSVPVVNAGPAESSVYKDTSTTLVDNPLYEVQQPSMTSSHAAETGDDVTDLTVIDNDLYER